MILMPYHVDVPMERWPFANWALMLLTIAVSFDAFSGVSGDGELQRWMMQGAGEWWSDAGLLGSIFTHGDTWHLLGNLFFLFIFGNAINAKLGPALFLASYVLLGLVSGMIYANSAEMPALGASGAISGITGMFIVLYPRNNVSVFFGAILLMRPIVRSFQVSAWVVIGAFFVTDLVYQAIADASGAQTGTAFMAHIAGTGAGAALACVLLLTRRIAPTPYEHTLIDLFREHMVPRAAAPRASAQRDRLT